jgi:hypothetical protein
VRTAVKRTNQLITQLAPVLNASFEDGFVTVNSIARAMAKYRDGKHYVFADSKENVTSNGTFTLAGITSDRLWSLARTGLFPFQWSVVGYLCRWQCDPYLQD